VRSPQRGFAFRRTRAADVGALFILRARTRENPLTAPELAELGITPELTRQHLAAGWLVGFVCVRGRRLAGFCSGDRRSGEILVVAVLAQFEGCGVGGRLLAEVSAVLGASGCAHLWLAAAANPQGRAHGFYRHLGWQPTGAHAPGGDEILALRLRAARAQMPPGPAA
jgi:ribosomal protein S18 acetylase RimI-like enzyme